MRNLLLVFIAVGLMACGNSNTGKDWSEQTKVAEKFMSNLVLGQADAVVQMMDDLVLGSADITALKGGIMDSRQVIVNRFGEGIPQMELVTAAPITYDGLPANLVVLKVENLTTFGYYDFVLNSTNNKVILMESKGRVYLK